MYLLIIYSMTTENVSTISVSRALYGRIPFNTEYMYFWMPFKSKKCSKRFCTCISIILLNYEDNPFNDIQNVLRLLKILSFNCWIFRSKTLIWEKVSAVLKVFGQSTKIPKSSHSSDLQGNQLDASSSAAKQVSNFASERHYLRNSGF